ncbi:hypothetical protein Ava_D0038 [Trichormus variabilis ATCC 29413]|uniref:Uncharacterized protein n=2 Tax=Anabaena variabilis TaxID=264691 RepID=Q3M2T3_TRIV2|nr:hypothetical protein [Trichormus variabilis]ABA24703.1 hypothetical protein Ava_D0038 [Trichormus variabilis ATCC 29413]MBC1217743.1 hypothetical protein [Trichormus variabilis ARAD]MBC1258966.1 hypothetical protein [Trichormus variabilis V5]MBC1302677.1 hypothetical protein [Trichormus variabilis N2B]MBC1324532.1 hypothetical protein [Trichormus variabilis 9RC]
MTYTDTKSQAKKRYTLREVQAIAKTYDLLIQPINANSRAPYGIFFDGQLVAEVKKLTDAIAIFPNLYTAIQEQLAEQAAAQQTTEVNNSQPVTLPTVGESYQIGGLTIKCAQIGGEVAVTWEVFDGGTLVGTISMKWDTFWIISIPDRDYSNIPPSKCSHTIVYATPQEATYALLESRSLALIT